MFDQIHKCRMRIIAIIFILFVVNFQSFFYHANAQVKGEAALTEPDILPKEAKDKSEKVAYLTFDDGPSTNTIPILDILDEYNIKATFFVMANDSEEGKIGYKEMIERGHTIALHTYSHNYAEIYTSPDAFFNNIKKLEAFLWDRYSIKTNILRFPGGSKNYSSKQYGGPQIMPRIIAECEKRGYRYFDWNIDSTDGISPSISVYTITSKVLNGAKHTNKAIILLHDINAMDNTVTSLPTIIKGLKKQGFSFDVIRDETEDMRFK
ncbi:MULTISPECIES: polysaccharide deacetylase family protein [Bacillus]|uniref:polysaccharide deacetylase family protein n=1 Tax=Bacillus TaxID=1386 RepID=UPI0002F9CD77|nr:MULTISPECIES: polysaccharide deacetylase family protein [Bacillus]